MVQKEFDRAVCLSHESFHLESLDNVRKFIFFNHYPQDLIAKLIKIRIEQVKSRQDSNVYMDTQSKAFDGHITIFLPYFGQI